MKYVKETFIKTFNSAMFLRLYLVALKKNQESFIWFNLFNQTLVLWEPSQKH